MPLKIVPASESDAPRIADIHMSAFGTNEMLLAQFPTAAVRACLWTSLVEKAVSEIRDPKWEVLLAREEDEEDDDDDHRSGREIVGFAKWCRPILEGEGYVEEPWRWPEGTEMEVLDKWTERVEAASEKVLGTRPCYRMDLSFCCVTSPPTPPFPGSPLPSLSLSLCLSSCLMFSLLISGQKRSKLHRNSP